jgi:hypothetical protein
MLVGVGVGAAPLEGPEAHPVAADAAAHLVGEGTERDQAEGPTGGAVREGVDAGATGGGVAEEALEERDLVRCTRSDEAGAEFLADTE